MYLHTHRTERFALVALGGDGPQTIETLEARSCACQEFEREADGATASRGQRLSSASSQVSGGAEALDSATWAQIGHNSFWPMAGFSHHGIARPGCWRLPKLERESASPRAIGLRLHLFVQQTRELCECLTSVSVASRQLGIGSLEFVSPEGFRGRSFVDPGYRR